MLSRLHRSGRSIPTLVLARSVSLDLRRRAFALGAYDVVGLPVAAQDLQARLRAALGTRMVQEELRDDPDTVRAGGLTVRASVAEVSDDAGWTVSLTQRETALLKALMLAPGRVVEHRELMNQVWPDGERGTGNGLAVLVRRLRAKLIRPGFEHGYVRTAHGRGYTFDARAVPRLAGSVPARGGLQVLVVEDDKATAAMIAEILLMQGYSVTSGVGPEAPTLARQTQPRVILLDINMPGMDGVEVRRQLRRSPRTAAIPVIALSAGHNLRVRASEMGADDYLAKPFSTDELLLRIAKWTGGAPGTANSANANA
jgi:DNA-binding response OmpR family regulator